MRPRKSGMIAGNGAQNLERSLAGLAAKLLRTKDDEQKRVARELHDSINQYHAAIKMNLRLLSRPQCPQPKRASLLDQSLDLVDACIRETRTISHLLHPPSLDKIGFASAAQWFVKGFSQRSGIRVSLHLARGLGRLPANVEIALFRVLQEALGNVHRHAHTRTADIWIERKATDLILRVRDHGPGIPAGKLRRLRQNGSGGVGIASMRARIGELNGRWNIRSSKRGTVVEVVIPVPGAKPKARLRKRPSPGAAAMAQGSR